MNNNVTHLIHNMPTQKKSHLSRRATGMVIAYRNGSKVMYGENLAALIPHEYLTEDHAMVALRHLAFIDQSQRMNIVCKDCGHPTADLAACPANPDGEHRVEVRAVPEIEIIDGEPKIVRPN